MKKAAKVGLGLAALIALAGAVAIAAPYPWSPRTANQSEEEIGQGQSREVSVGLRGIVEYTVRDPDGNIREHGIHHNTINDPEALNEVFNRITSGGVYGADDAYHAIVALTADATADDPSDGVKSSSIGDNLDGDPATGGNQNPADGAVATDFGTESGNGTIKVTFIARDDNVTIMQVVLTKAAEDDTTTGGPPKPSIDDADILAYQDVTDVTLNTNDTVQYTWTIDTD